MLEGKKIKNSLDGSTDVEIVVNLNAQNPIPNFRMTRKSRVRFSLFSK